MQNLIEKLGWGDTGASMMLWMGASVILLLIVMAIAVWLIRMLRPSLNMGGGSGRGGRPQRLAVTDAFSLDRDGRRLVIIRRDNVEHLLLIGGPNDVVVEANITRNERAIRDRGTRGAEADAVQIAETALIGDGATRLDMPPLAPPPQPTQPAPLPPLTSLRSAAPPSAPLPTPAVAKPIVAPRPIQPAAPPAVAPLPAPPPISPATPPAPASAPPPASAQKLDEDFEKALAAMQAAQRQKLEQPAPVAPVHPVPPPVTPPPVHPAAPAPERPARQEPMSEMARRLNEVLQKPLSGQLRPPFNKQIPPVPPVVASPPKAEASPPPVPPTPPPLPDLADLPELPAAPASAAPTSAQPPAIKGADTEMDALEEEMARLLGRPSQPPKPGKP